MKQVAAFILLAAFTFQTFEQGWYCIDYRLRHANYEANCINKYRPELACHGQCQLMKKLAAAEKRNQQQAPELKLAGKCEWVNDNNDLFQLHSFYTFISSKFFLFNSGTTVDRAFSIFHPPGVA